MKRFFAFLALLVALPAWSAAIVQIDKQDVSANTTHTLSYAGGFTNGNLAVLVMLVDATSITSVVTAGSAQSCTLGGSSLNFEGTLDAYAYVCPNATGSTTGFTVTLGSSAGMLAVVAEISGYDTSTPFDAIGPKAGSFATTSTRASVTNNAVDSIAIGIMYTSGTAGFTADSGYTSLEDETTSVAYYSNTGMGAAGAKVTGGVMGSATYGYGAVATFRNTSGGGGGGGAPKQMTTLKAG